ncbi:putative defense protein 3 [Myxocyprinus asiaticus]|uniref:putative defense protein 3 n=1 Tax=Myxocyprinus asiaticus TaxID=70543 RepID=UPI0022215280|nr:putative defense protein 3 [Myxocyprinus asiaticus]
MHGQFVLVVLVCWINLHVVTTYPNGQVTSACMSMTPQHGANNISRLQAPYTVSSNVSTYTNGQKITVTLQANRTGFMGFLLQASYGTGPVGTFTVMGNNTQLLNCGGMGSAVSHTSKDAKTTIVAQWKAPDSGNKDINFRATFVQNFSLFWVGVQSETVRFMATNPPNTTANSTTESPNCSPSISLAVSLLFLPLLAIT